jgi:CHAT domain-containing protein
VSDRPPDPAGPESEDVEELVTRIKAACDAVPNGESLPSSVLDSWFHLIRLAEPAARSDLVSKVGDYLLERCKNFSGREGENAAKIACVIPMAHLLAWYQHGDVKDLQAAVSRAEQLHYLVSDESQYSRLAMMIDRIARKWANLPSSLSNSRTLQPTVSASSFDWIVEWLDLAIADDLDEDQVRAELARLDTRAVNGSIPSYNLRVNRITLRLRLLRMSGSDSDRQATLNDLTENIKNTSPGTWEYANSRLQYVEWLELNPGLRPEVRTQVMREMLREVAQDQAGWTLSRITAATKLLDYCLFQDSEPVRWLYATLAGFVAVQVGHRFVGLSGAGAELVLDRIQGLAQRGAYAALKAGNAEQAIWLLEGGAGLLTAKRLQLQQTQERDDAAHQTLLADFQSLGRSIRSEWTVAWEKSAGVINSQERLLAWSNISESLNRWDSVRRQVEADTDVEIADYFTPEMVAELAADTHSTIVYITAVPGMGFALIVRADTEPEVRWLAGLSEEQVTQWSTDLSAALDKSGEQDLFHKNMAIEEILGGLADVLDALPQGRLLVIPTGRLGSLPLQAALHSRRDRVVSAAVNARMHDVAFRQAQASSGTAIFAVANPMPCTGRQHPLGPLPRAEAEARNVAARGGFALTGYSARKASLIEQARSPLLALHLALHGAADPKHPYMTKMFLADGEDGFAEELTVGELQPQARLVVLSSCWLGSMGQRLPDEAQGFPSALIEAGCCGVLSALWPVSDGATEELMKCFYSSWLDEGREPAEALAKAHKRIQKYFSAADAAAWQFTGF